MIFEIPPILPISDEGGKLETETTRTLGYGGDGVLVLIRNDSIRPSPHIRTDFQQRKAIVADGIETIGR